MPDIIITPSSGIIDFFPVSTRVGRIEGSGNTINIVNPSGFVAVSGSGLSINIASPNAIFHAYSATSGATLLNLEGTNGSLFSVVDSLSGSLMSVNNNAGLPVLEVFSDDSIVGGRFGQNDFVVSSGGNVGIGTASPSAKLHVVGSGIFSSGLSVTGLLTSTSGNFTSSLQVNGTNVSVSGHSHSSSDITNFNSSVSGLLPTISNSGDNRVLTSTGSSVGINAESNLTFNGSLLSVTGSGIFASGLTVNELLTSTGGNFSFTTNDMATINTDGTNINVSANNQLFLDSENTIAMQTTNGAGYHVGIGTNDAISLLTLVGNAETNSLLKVGNLEFQPYALNNAWIGENVYFNGSSFLRRSTGSAGLFYFQGSEGQFRFSNNGSAGASISSNPVWKITHDGAMGVGSGMSSSTGSLTNAKFVVASNGNVGIGNTSPAAKLDVTGNVNIDGNLTFDSFTESVVAIGNSSTSKTLDLTTGTVQTCTLTDNCVFTMPTVTAGKSFTLFLSTGAGSFTGTFTGVRWAGGTAPTITTTASKVDILSFISDGSFWYGSYSQNYG